MGQRNSGMAKRRHNLYETPAWTVSDALAPFFPLAGLDISEPACGNGKLVAALDAAGARAWPSDLVRHPRLPVKTSGLGRSFVQADFLDGPLLVGRHRMLFDAIVTNPPYGVQGALACRFIMRGLQFLRLKGSPDRFVALLLPVDFDSAATRGALFDQCPEFHGQIVLRRRVEWFLRKRKADGSKGNGPSQNHAWFIWTARRRAPGVLPVKYYQPVGS